MSGAGVSGNAPIGVFDSGLGGLSVAWEIRRLMPNENIVYIGDTAHVPYGPRPEAEVRAFSRGITRYLAAKANCRVVVVACNTAVSAGIDTLREAFIVPIVAIEPGIKPAVAQTKTNKVGVLATLGTAGGERLHSLIERFGGDVETFTQPCPGLVECVERGDLNGPEARSLAEKYVRPLMERGADTLVLGCTHYPFLRPLIEEIAGSGVQIIDTGEAVARQAARVAPCHALTREAPPTHPLMGGEGNGNHLPITGIPSGSPINGGKGGGFPTGGIECFVTGDIAASVAGLWACFAFYGAEAPPLRRLTWHGKELYDDGAS